MQLLSGLMQRLMGMLSCMGRLSPCGVAAAKLNQNLECATVGFSIQQFSDSDNSKAAIQAMHPGVFGEVPVEGMGGVQKPSSD